jgi:hypothetical protein
MLKPLLAPLIALCLIAGSVAAQVAPVSPMGAFGEKQMDPAQLALMIGHSQRLLKPASYVLAHKADLALTEVQVQRLEILARAQDDSVVVRQIRMTSGMALLFKKRQESGIAPDIGWVGPIDEKRLRDEACEQAGLTTEFAIGVLRDRLAVGTILTGTQIDRLPGLEAGDAMRAITSKAP